MHPAVELSDDVDMAAKDDGGRVSLKCWLSLEPRPSLWEQWSGDRVVTSLRGGGRPCLYRWVHGGSEREDSLPKVTQRSRWVGLGFPGAQAPPMRLDDAGAGGLLGWEPQQGHGQP